MLLDENRLKELNILEKVINYEFKNKKLLNSAFIHTSYTNENPSLLGKSNERLEFLGDAVLEIVFSEILFKNFLKKDEGFLTKLRANLVCEPSFSALADEIDLSNYLLLGKGEEKTGGRDKTSLKADAFEAFNGALYLDGGYEQVYSFIYDLIIDKLENSNIIRESLNDYKSMLQEYLHKHKNINCTYVLTKEQGPSHDKEFFMDAYIGDRRIGSGKGRNKKLAEQMAAKDALENLNAF